jgi:hypothetical protein
MSTFVQRRPRAGRALRREATDGRTRSRRRLAAGLVSIGAGLAAVSAVGPFVSGLIDYRVTETLRNQTIGLDATSLLVVAPLSVLAAALVLRRQVAGLTLAVSIGAYTSYMFLQYILGPDYASLPGNNERAFPLYLFLFAAGWLVALAAWRALPADRLHGTRRRDRMIAAVLGVLGLVTFVRYLPALADWTSTSPDDEVYLAGPGFSWAIAMLDLGVVLPATVAACFGLVRGTPWARKLAYAVGGWFGLVGPAVAAMAITMYVNDDPNVSGGNTVFMSALGLAFAALAVWLYRSLLSARKRA